MSGDTESENEIKHLQLRPMRIANFFRPREERDIKERQKRRNEG